ncbi:MAG: GntR family transcriptional regulator [Pseudomonadota bacterium]
MRYVSIVNELNRNTLPLYVQIAELLSREISAGIWPDGTRLPTEAELAAQLNVAIGTLRKSLAILEDRALLERIQGSGTYVRRKAKTGAIYEFLRLELTSGSTGLPTAKTLSVDKQPTPDFLPAFGDGRSSHAWRVRRLRHLGATPAALEEIWFDARHAERLHIDSIGDSMHLFYKEKLGFWIARVEDKVSASLCPDFSPDQMFEPGLPFGYVERISWGNAGMVEEYSRNWFDPQTVAYAARWV